MADICSVCGIQFIKGGSFIKNRDILCPACYREFRAMLGEVIPLTEFGPAELKSFMADPSTCPSPSANTYKNTVKDLMLQRNDMRAAMAASAPTERPSGSSGGNYDALIDLRKLLDAGIITEEEFSAKKRQILGI